MLTHGVYDSLTGDKISEHPNIAEAMKHSSELGGWKKGYVVDRIKWEPPKEIPKIANPAASTSVSISDMASRKQPEAPSASVASDPEGPGLFD